MQFISEQDQQDRDLLNEGQRVLVKRIIAQSQATLTDGQVRIYSTAICNFQKLVIQRDKIVSARETERDRNATRLEIARIRAETALTKRDRNAADHPQRDDDDPTAPYGRKKDGTAYTPEEFKESLDQAINDIYGLPPINPKSQMPGGWNRSSDADPSIRARSASDGSDIADDAALRAGGASLPLERSEKGPGRPSEDDPSRAPLPAQDPFVIRNSSFGIISGASSNPKETAPGRYPSGDG